MININLDQLFSTDCSILIKKTLVENILSADCADSIDISVIFIKSDIIKWKNPWPRRMISQIKSQLSLKRACIDLHKKVLNDHESDSA